MSNREQVVLNGRYELHRRVGRGGMAEVYLARDRLLDRLVAIKILFPEFATDPSFVARFRREAQAAANLNHPNIVGVYDWGKERGTYYIVMEYVDGQSISDILRADGPIEAKRAAGIAADVAAALGFAHRKGVVHRDVKPGNVLITKAGEVKVADFGIARAMTSSGEENLTQTGSVMGTATYFSPEQAQGKPVDARTDLYSLGVVLYEMAAGKPPFSGDSPVAIAYQHVQEPLPPLHERAPGVPEAYEAITVKALAKDPADRYPDGAAMRADLLRFREGRPVEAAAAGAAVPVPAGPATSATAAVPRQAVPVGGPARPVAGDDHPPRRRTGWFFVVILVLLALLGALLFAFGRQLGIFEDKAGPQVEVADVVGDNVVIARNLLEQDGFVVELRTEKSDKPDGEVLEQDPAGGTEADEGSTVTLTHAIPLDDIVLVDVSGRPAPDAEATLREAGFTNITQRPEEVLDVDGDGILDGQVAIGSVIRTDPGPGSYPADQLITLFVAAEPQTTTTSATTVPETTTTSPPVTTTTSPPVTTTSPPATTTTSPPATTTTSPPATTTTAAVDP